MRSIMTNMTTTTNMTLWTKNDNGIYGYLSYNFACMTKYDTDFAAQTQAETGFVMLSHLSQWCTARARVKTYNMCNIIGL